MAICMTAEFEVRIEELERAQKAILTFVDYLRANEPTTRLYTSLQEQGSANRFLHYFIFDDEAAMAMHRTSDGVQHFTDTLYPLLVAPVEFTQYTLFASTDEYGQDAALPS